MDKCFLKVFIKRLYRSLQNPKEGRRTRHKTETRDLLQVLLPGEEGHHHSESTPGRSLVVYCYYFWIVLIKIQSPGRERLIRQAWFTCLPLGVLRGWGRVLRGGPSACVVRGPDPLIYHLAETAHQGGEVMSLQF